ncbi:hypothetical protein P152DRAFT_445798 [Eremomyces bilateralis CBS 781.70]|uniref:Uncharacterized protein n=1 Tax=Eremomyces bilateralis CBS 781.70 TaxID=1392243 RepID=A0A6G1GDK7_9PEZI|nr:uncharacterized protein P152DRAFT_445798 [Eremomyces bilateralis CBS 781.70]KAF1816102.1 hypothetical protein P152DRAFT_445798 [Eremomyces bilateralis CBS 781.70]
MDRHGHVLISIEDIILLTINPRSNRKPQYFESREREREREWAPNFAGLGYRIILSTPQPDPMYHGGEIALLSDSQRWRCPMARDSWSSICQWLWRLSRRVPWTGIDNCMGSFQARLFCVAVAYPTLAEKPQCYIFGDYCTVPERCWTVTDLLSTMDRSQLQPWIMISQLQGSHVGGTGACSSTTCSVAVTAPPLRTP